MVAIKLSLKSILLCALFLIPLACKGDNKQDELDAAVRSFIELKNNEDYHGVWNMLSNRLKEGNDYNESRYIGELKTSGFHSNGIVVADRKIAGNTATVRVTVSYVDNGDQPVGTAEEEWLFIEEGGTWYFDDYRTISEQ